MIFYILPTLNNEEPIYNYIKNFNSYYPGILNKLENKDTLNYLINKIKEVGNKNIDITYIDFWLVGNSESNTLTIRQRLKVSSGIFSKDLYFIFVTKNCLFYLENITDEINSSIFNKIYEVIPDSMYVDKYNFIDTILKNPDSIPSIIKNSKYQTRKDYSGFHNLYSNDSLIGFIPYIKEFGTAYNLYYDDFSFIWRDIWGKDEIGRSKITNYGYQIENEIIIESKINTLYLKFYFLSIDDTLSLVGMSREKKTDIELFDEYQPPAE